MVFLRDVAQDGLSVVMAEGIPYVVFFLNFRYGCCQPETGKPMGATTAYAIYTDAETDVYSIQIGKIFPLIQKMIPNIRHDHRRFHFNSSFRFQ